MEIIAGMVVRSVAGHDKGGFFVVLRTEEGYAYIADGKRRLVENPKRKKFRHLRPTKSELAIKGITNKKLRGLLMPFNRTDKGGNELV